jgi:hypothetical protein
MFCCAEQASGSRNLAVAWRPVNRLWRSGFGCGLMRRIADEQSFPDECLTLPEEALAVLVHLRPEAHFVECAFQAHLRFGALDEDEVSVAWTADAFVANGLARDFHGVRTRLENWGPTD